MLARALPARQSYLFKSTLNKAYPSDTAILKPPSDVGESLPARQSYLFSSPKLGEAYLSDTAIAEATVGHRREPPSQTSLPFKSHARRGLPVRHGRLLKPPSDVGESLPARQTHPFRLFAPQYRTPSNATCLAVQAILAFSPLPARFNHPTHEYGSHVGCRKSLPAGQPHLFLLRQRS